MKYSVERGAYRTKTVDTAAPQRPAVLLDGDAFPYHITYSGTHESAVWSSLPPLLIQDRMGLDKT